MVTWLNWRLWAGVRIHVVDLFRKKYMAGAQLKKNTNSDYRARMLKILRSPRIDSRRLIPPASVAWALTFKLLRSPRIDSMELTAYVAWQAGTSKRVVVPARHAENRFLGFLKGLQIRALACRNDNPISTRFLSPTDCFKIPALRPKEGQDSNLNPSWTF